MVDVLSLIRRDLQGFAGYCSAAKKAGGAMPAVKLNANESPWPPFGQMASLCAPERYPEPQPLLLRQRLASYWGTEPESLLLTAGSDQGIDVLIRLFCEAGRDEVLVCPPTFSMYEVWTKLQGGRLLSVPLLENGQLDLERIKKTVSDNTKLLFIPSPNAPLGHAMSRDDLLSLCAVRKGKSVIVVDEAYVAFSARPDGLLPELKNYENLVILRTLSKASALAGERIGCVIAVPAVIQALSAVVPPYPLAQSGIRAALDAFSPAGLMARETQRKIIMRERERMRAELIKAVGVRRVFPSEGNFLFIETTDAQAFMMKLRRFDILPRLMDDQVKGGVRLSIGSPEQNDLVLRALGVDIETKNCSDRLFGVQRKTKETSIDVSVNLDNASRVNIKTGLGFFDHMLEQIAVHGGIGLVVEAQGDLQVDAHHTVEDCALALGETIKGALGNKKGIARFGFTLPLDEALAQVTLDLSARPFLQVTGAFPAYASDGMDGGLVEHFFRSLSVALSATIHLSITGQNNHHMIEACFKAFGRALRQAVAFDGSAALPSSKGAL